MGRRRLMRSRTVMEADAACRVPCACGSRTALDIRQRKQTGDVRLFPFLAAAVKYVGARTGKRNGRRPTNEKRCRWAAGRGGPTESCGLWTGYGLLQGVLTVVVVNGVGFVLSSIYIGVFYVYAKEKVRAHSVGPRVAGVPERQANVVGAGVRARREARAQAAVQAWILNSCGLVVFVALYMWLLDPATRVLHMGVLCACTSTLMFGSPLVALVGAAASPTQADWRSGITWQVGRAPVWCGRGPRSHTCCGRRMRARCRSC